MRKWLSPELFEGGLMLALCATGVTGAALALLLGKLFAAAILAAVALGCFLRFKRGRVRRPEGG